MKINSVFINTYKYDFEFAKICIASIRYWYPDMPIYLIKDLGAGNFNTKKVEASWNVKLFNCNRNFFGWGYGKLEPLFSNDNFSFLVLDADTVFAGPVLNAAEDSTAQFIVDEEVQTEKRLGEIYYNLEKLKQFDAAFEYPGYSFNTGQWFGTAGIFTREDLEPLLGWEEPPIAKHPEIFFNGDQGIFNYALQKKEQENKIVVRRKKIMIWPEGKNADFIDLQKIQNKTAVHPVIMHWAGMKFKKINTLPRVDILRFYKTIYYDRMGNAEKYKDILRWKYLQFVKKYKSL